MNVTLEIPEDLKTYVMNRLQTGDYATTIEYVLDLVVRDRDRTLAQEKLVNLLQESLDSEAEVVTKGFSGNFVAT
jgi:Arc/MetJ-type ribon-helix-helix transcriptional regulator